MKYRCTKIMILINCDIIKSDKINVKYQKLSFPFQSKCRIVFNVFTNFNNFSHIRTDTFLLNEMFLLILIYTVCLLLLQYSVLLYKGHSVKSAFDTYIYIYINEIIFMLLLHYRYVIRYNIILHNHT